MNLVILSGYLSDKIEQKTMPDGQEIIDACLLKKYTNKDTGEEFRKKYFLTITGKNVPKFLRDYSPDDNVLVRGILSAGSDEKLGYFTKIFVKSMCKLSGGDMD